jgi:hypothetical protein
MAEKLIAKLNEYHENNLRGVSMKSILDHLKELDRQGESKASILELKKLMSNSRKYHRV